MANQSNTLTEIDAEISALRGEEAPKGNRKKDLQRQLQYYKGILALYAEKEEMLHAEVQRLRERKAKSSESKLRKLIIGR